MKTRILVPSLVLFVAVFAAVWIAGAFLTRSTVNAGDVVFNRISTNGADWVELYNRTGSVIDLSDYLLSDGKSTYRLPKQTLIQPKGFLVMAQDKDVQKARADGVKPDLTWSGFGFGHSKREFALLLNRGGKVVIDFVHTVPLEKGEVLERDPTGSENWVIADGSRKQPAVLEAGAPSANGPDVNQAAIAQAALSLAEFLKQFLEKIAAILAACSFIGFYIGLVSKDRQKPAAASVA
jgi:hypothetical protein